MGRSEAINTEARNTLVDRHVTIQHVSVFDLQQFNRNQYLLDNRIVPGNSLSFLERGHAYRVRVIGDRANIQCTLRIADEETAALLSDLRVTNEDPNLTSRYADRPIHTPTALAHQWSISAQFLDLFRNRVIVSGGEIMEESYTVEEVTRRTAVLRNQVDQLTAQRRLVNERLSLARQANRSEREDLAEEVISLARALQESIEEWVQQHKEAGAFANAALQVLPARESAQIEVILARVDGARRRVGDLDPAGAVRSAKGLLQGDDTIAPCTLSEALGPLRAFFPVLKHITVVDEETLAVQVNQAVITLRGDDFEVSGDTSVLHAGIRGTQISEVGDHQFGGFTFLGDKEE